MSDRYSRQEAFFGIQKEGQQKLGNARVTIIGLGALGTVTADHLARAGVGFLRLADRDYVELSNLQRQTLYDEADAAGQVPKAEAAAAHLRAINSEIEIEPVITDVNSSTIDALIEDVDLVVDATDNMSTRFLLNEACLEYRIPWIYGGAIGATGMLMNILPDEDRPCLACFGKDEESGMTCATAGVLNTTTAIVASLQCTEAIKILTGNGDLLKGLRVIDLWGNEDDVIPIEKNKDCLVCVKHEYKYYGKPTGMKAVSLCGRDSVQIVPAAESRVDFEQYAEKLKKIPGTAVTYNQFTLDFDHGDFQIKLFRNGRAIIKHVTDEGRAKSIYAEYIGL